MISYTSPEYHSANGREHDTDYFSLSLSSDKQDKKWYKQLADIYASSFYTLSSFEMKNYKKYRGIRDNKDFAKKLGNYSDTKLPVPDVPHVPLIRLYIDALVSINKIRPLVYNIKYNDADAIQDKDRELTEKVTQELLAVVMDSVGKDIRQYQQGGQVDENKAQQEIEEKVQKIIDSIPNFRTVQERVAQKVLDTCMERLNLRSKFSTAFLDQLIAGKSYYRCKLQRLGELPIFEIINPVEISFSADKVDNLNQCMFVVHKKDMSIQDVYALYGGEFTKEDMDTLKIYDYPVSTNRNKMYEYSAIVDENNGYIGSTNTNMIEVYEMEWKVNKKVPVVELDGKFEILNSDGVIEKPTKQKDIKYKYYQELHTCTRIGNSIYVRWGKVKYARRDPNDISKVLLSFNGKLYNDRNNPPLSLVAELSDLQDRYDILWYKLFEMIMLSGNKGAMLIEELLPPDMTAQEWLYWRKLGIARLSISSEGIDPNLISQIGQSLQTYDDSLSANGVDSALKLIQQIDKTVSDITGVPPQMRGQISEYETKANAELSVTQGTITTEKIHQFHSEFQKEALNDLLHWSKIGLTEGTLKDYILTKAEQELTKDSDWTFIDYNVLLVDGYKEEKALRNANQIVGELVKSQALGFDTLVKTQMVGSLNELDNIVTKAIKNMQDRQQKQMEMEQQTKQQEIQGKLQLEQAKLQQQAQESQANMQLEQSKLVQEGKLKEEEIVIKDRLATVEEGYLEVAKKELDAGINTANKKLDAREGRNK